MAESTATPLLFITILTPLLLEIMSVIYTEPGFYIMIVAFMHILSSIFVVRLYMDHEKQVLNIVKHPIFIKDDRPTGYPELDALFTSDPFEVEIMLFNGGMHLGEIKALTELAQVMAQSYENEQRLVSEPSSIRITTATEASPQALELVRRAVEIMSGGSTPKLMPITSNVSSALDMMEHAGIPIFNRNMDMRLSSKS